MDNVEKGQRYLEGRKKRKKISLYLPYSRYMID